MKFNRSALVLILLASITMSSMIVGSAKAEPSFSDPIMDPKIMADATDDNSTSSMWDVISDTLTRAFNLLVDIILAPFNAIATVFQNWGASLSSWYAPIVAVFVILIIVVLIRLYSEFDEVLDLNN